MARTVLKPGTMETMRIAAGSADGEGALSKAQVVLLLRWVLIIATSYLVIFSRPLTHNPTSAGLFVALYFASNIVLSELLQRFPSDFAFNVTVVLLDTLMVAVGLALSGAASSEFYVVYFIVLFLSALSERLGLVVGATVLISTAHLYTESRYLGIESLMTPGQLLRVPFLFVVAMFFGNLVQEARSRDREASESRARERRMAFLSGISHDLKNPLGVVQSLAMLLLEGDAGPLNEQQAELVHRIHASTRHTITFAFNIIDAARIDAGRLVLQRRPVSLKELVEDALSLARSAGQLKGVALHSVIEPGLPPAEVDGVQIERVIENIVGNAVKFTPPGGTVTLALQHVVDTVVLSVRDDGPGIAAGELPTIFEQYRRHTDSGSVDGSGLGLFIVKAIVEAHGGSVAVDSAAGRGTTVTVKLPLAHPGPASSLGAPLASYSRRWWPARLRLSVTADADSAGIEAATEL